MSYVIFFIINYNKYIIKLIIYLFAVIIQNIFKSSVFIFIYNFHLVC